MAHATPVSPAPSELFLLGRPEIRRNGQPLHGQPPIKGQALLFYLAVTRNTLTREALAGPFWGDMSEEMARSNLRLKLMDNANRGGTRRVRILRCAAFP